MYRPMARCGLDLRCSTTCLGGLLWHWALTHNERSCFKRKLLATSVQYIYAYSCCDNERLTSFARMKYQAVSLSQRPALVCCLVLHLSPRLCTTNRPKRLRSTAPQHPVSSVGSARDSTLSMQSSLRTFQ
jgi:hypothetical protein